MIFSSVEFLFYFLPIFLLVYQVSGRHNAVLLVGSAVFYAWGELRNAWVLAASLAGCYLGGLALGREADRRDRQRWVLVVSLLFQLSLLVAFKYLGFLADTLHDLGWQVSIEPGSVPVLPVGISFFTFHAMSYLVDIYRGQLPVERKLSRLTNYILLFPHLLAGPLVRYAAIRRQLIRRHWTVARLRFGMELLIIGLGQKLLLANPLGTVVDAIYQLDSHALTTALAWLGAIAYAFQVYLDFSGYSHMALGLALLLGFSFPRNFRFPFHALSVREFWRRWHISLSSWLRDYVYTPLGGSRRGGGRTIANILIVFGLCGLWHGAGWNFVCWGLYNGGLIVLERLGLGRITARWPRVCQQIYAWLAFTTGVAMFRAEDFAQVGTVYAAMAGWSSATAGAMHPGRFLDGYTVLVLLLAFSSMLPLSRWFGGRHFVRPRWALVRWVFLTLVLLLGAMSLASGSHNPFLYFRF